MNLRTSAIQMTLLIAVIYLGLTANLELSNLVAAVLIGMAISWLIRPRQLTIAWQRLPLAIWSLLRYLGILVLDLVMSGIQVGGIILHPRLPIDPGIVMIDTGCQSELGTALSAHALTLTPGEMVVEMDDQGRLFVHCLDASNSAQYVADAQELRQELLSKIFE